jgi:uncharacterized cupin superfamily protein
MSNLNSPDWEPEEDEPEGFRSRAARLGTAAGAARVGVTIWELPPGQSSCPYHWHVAEEEMLIALDDGISLRTPEGWRQLEKGQVVAFLAGPEGAHLVSNFGDTTVRFLMAGTNETHEIAFYPDGGKVGVFAPGLRKLFRERDAVDYWDGESAPER